MNLHRAGAHTAPPIYGESVAQQQDRRDRFEELARGLVEPLRRYLARRTDPATADDVLGDTLLVLWRRFDDLPELPLPWAYAVARRCLANAQRGEQRQRRLAVRIATSSREESVPGPERIAETDDPELAAALAALRPADAELLRLWAWEQLTPAEIAAVLDITPNAAGIRLHRARERLRVRLRKDPLAAGHKESRGGSAP